MLSKIDNSNIIARVYQNLKLLVISHQFPAGERLNIETLAENLQNVIFEDHSMVLAGPGTHN